MFKIIDKEEEEEKPSFHKADLKFFDEISVRLKEVIDVITVFESDMGEAYYIRRDLEKKLDDIWLRTEKGKRWLKSPEGKNRRPQ